MTGVQTCALPIYMYHSWGDWQGNLLAEGFYTNISDVFALTEIGKDENGVTKYEIMLHQLWDGVDFNSAYNEFYKEISNYMTLSRLNN